MPYELDSLCFRVHTFHTAYLPFSPLLHIHLNADSIVRYLYYLLVVSNYYIIILPFFTTLCFAPDNMGILTLNWLVLSNHTEGKRRGFRRSLPITGSARYSEHGRWYES